MRLANNLQTSSRRSKSGASKVGRLFVNRIEVASSGIALLLMEDLENDVMSRQLEVNIRKLVPDVIIFSKEEDEDTQGCSIESQLKNIGWKGGKNEASRKEILQEWESGLNRFLTDERTKATKRQFTWAVTGLSVMLLYGLFGGNGV